MYVVLDGTYTNTQLITTQRNGICQRLKEMFHLSRNFYSDYFAQNYIPSIVRIPATRIYVTCVYVRLSVYI
jgi:hypothetical protein